MTDSPPRCATCKWMTPEEESALRWLRDCDWRGWLQDQLDGSIVTSEGVRFDSARALRRWLLSLERWPKVRNVPYCGDHAPREKEQK